MLVLLPSIRYRAWSKIDDSWRSWLRSGKGPRHTLTDAPSRRAGVLTWGIVAAITAALIGMPASGAAAQGTVIIGGDGKPNVEVDLGVIEALGRPPGPFGMRPWLSHVDSTNPTVRLRLLAPAVSNLSRGAASTVATSRLTLTPPNRPPRAAPLPRATRRPAPPPPAEATTTPLAQPAQAVPLAASKAPPAPTKRPVAAPLPPKATIPLSTAATALPKAITKAPVTPKPAVSPPSTPPPAAVDRAPSRVAALPRAAQPSAVGQALQLKFATESSSLSQRAEQQLRALAGELSGETARLELKAYAGEADRTASAARRLSLSRALAVRSFLIEQGIRSTRIGVRAFGFPTDGGPSERVDVVLLAR